MSCSAYDPWLRYRDSGLYAVPSIHYRQIFAQLVFEACYRKKFDVIAVELPPSYQHFGIVDAALQLASAPGLIINPTGGRVELMEVPISDDPTHKETELRQVKRGLFYAFTPCDSIVMALRCPQLLRNHWPFWKPEIALIDAEYRVGERPHVSFPFRDDYEVKVEGLPTFIQRMETQLNAARCPMIDNHRDKVMGSRLRRFVDSGKEVLFVCGAAHWRSICDYLDSGIRETLEPFREQPPARLIMAPIRPDIAWLWGWLDDIPHILWQMELCIQRGDASGYDKRQSVELFVRETINEAREKQIPMSIRRMLNLSRFAETLASAAGNWIPELDDHLVLAAKCCVETRFAEVLKKKALEFPAPLPPGTEMARVLPAEDGKWFVIAEGEVFLIEFPKSIGRRCRRISIPVPPKLTKEEKRQSDKELNGFRDWPEEQKLSYVMDMRARDLARRQEREIICSKFVGSMSAGPDWRRTIRARASGETALYVRQVRTNGRRLKAMSSLVTPIVWIFEGDSKITNIEPRGAWMDNGEMAYMGLFYVIERKWILNGEIRSIKLAALCDLGHSRSFCGNQRPSVTDGKNEMEADTRYLRSIPAEKRCTRSFWSDEELSHFSGVEHAFASAIKYAADKIIVVSRSHSAIPPPIQRYAQLKQVTICRVSIDCFAPERLARFQWIHFVKCPGQDGYATPYDWCSRFVPPI